MINRSQGHREGEDSGRAAKEAECERARAASQAVSKGTGQAHYKETRAETRTRAIYLEE